MGTRTVAFRLNSKNPDDKEIMDWLDAIYYKHKIFDSVTEAVKWAVLCFARNEIQTREEMDMTEAMHEYIEEFAEKSKADNEQIMQDAITRILATIISAMGQQTGGCVTVPAMMQMQGMNGALIQPETHPEPTEPMKETAEKLSENNLELSNKPLDEGAVASLSAMFGDDED